MQGAAQSAAPMGLSVDSAPHPNGWKNTAKFELISVFLGSYGNDRSVPQLHRYTKPIR